MSVVLLTAVKAYMNITVTTTDAELQSFIDVAEQSIVNKCGPLAAATYTRRARGGKDFLSVFVTPVLSLTSVTPVSGTALDVTKLNADRHGAIEYLTGGTFSAPFYDVVYQAGRTSVPVDLAMAVCEHARHLWDSQIGGTRRPGQNSPANVPGAAYAFTYKVNELIGPHLQPGLA